MSPESHAKLSPKLTEQPKKLNLLGNDSVPEGKEPGTPASTEMKQERSPAESVTRDVHRDTSIQVIEMPEILHDESRRTMLDIKAEEVDEP